MAKKAPVDRKMLVQKLLKIRELPSKLISCGEVTIFSIWLPYLNEDMCFYLDISSDNLGLVCILDYPDFQKKSNLEKLTIANDLSNKFPQTKFYVRDDDLMATYHITLPDKGERVLLELMELVLMDFIGDLEDVYADLVEAGLRLQRYENSKASGVDTETEEGWEWL